MVIIGSIVLLSALILWCYHFTAQLRIVRWQKHCIDGVISLIFVMNLYRLGKLWHYPMWGRWVLTIGVAAATILTLLFVTAIFWSVAMKSSDAFVDYFKHYTHGFVQLKSTMRQDFWSFVRYCIYDEDNERTWKIFEQ